jgi:2-polyprenyl-6-methoxyphenol hydroxylase-like FAD-dependent oxidoreductase
MAHPFKVLIVGGSITGLSLALMLQRNGIDFVILEAYPEIAPQVGASIGLLPNGFRILDQLGCYEDILKVAENVAVDRAYLRGPDGETMWEMEGVNEQVVERWDLLFSSVALSLSYGYCY